MSTSDGHPAEMDEEAEELEEVDVDLDAIMEDEATGEPITVRLDGSIIHIAHTGDWSSSAMRAASSGDWDTWARAVIDDDREYEIWEDADLRNSQIEKVFQQCARQSRMNMGKSAKRASSRRGTRKR